jgi:glycosyltransferase involved in cell wall biosynthesis
MKIGFVFNIRFPYYNGTYYAVDLPASVWHDRYLPFCDSLKVIGRKDALTEKPSVNLSVSSTENVEFSCVDNDTPFKMFLHSKRYSRHLLSELADCDFVICRGYWGVRECIKLGKPYLLEAVGCFWDAHWNHSWQGKMVAYSRFLAFKRVAKNAPYTIYVTKEFLQKRYPCSGEHIGVSDVRLLSLENDVLEKRLERIKKRRSDDKIVIGTTAAIDVRYKGQQYVIKALSKLKKQGITCYEYQMVGAGDTRYLRGVAEMYDVSEYVVFKGPMIHSDVFQWLDTVDIYIQPSLQEGLPRAVVEAMSRGCPAMGTRTGGTPELLNKSYVLNRKSVDDIVKKLRLLDTEVLVSEAKRSFAKAKEFDAATLDGLRSAFMQKSINNQLPSPRNHLES